MTVAHRLESHLQQSGVAYDVRHHPYCEGSERTAHIAGVPASQVAKAVLTEDHEGRHLLAVIPSDRRLSLYHLGTVLRRSFRLASEFQVDMIFGDCVRGAVPPIGAPYRVETVVDDALLKLDDVWLEAGDHEDLIHMTGSQFRALMANAPHGYFSASRQDDYSPYS
jgi:Ala-tRNA(Pro) deacylase